MPLIEVEKGIEIYYEEYGQGDRYLICSQQSHAQHSLEKELVKYGFHVFLLTNRGFGRSTHLKEDYGDYSAAAPTGRRDRKKKRKGRR